jgi:hypothetical protein
VGKSKTNLEKNRAKRLRQKLNKVKKNVGRSKPIFKVTKTTQRNTNFVGGAVGRPGMISTVRSNMGMGKIQRDYMLDKYCSDLLDPWNAQDARLPSTINIFSNCAKVKSDFQLVTNVSGALFAYFDPDFCASAVGTSQTSFLFFNQQYSSGSVAYTGNVVVTAATYSTGPGGSVPVPPASTVFKTRLVSAAIKVTPKISALNTVGTIFACFDYGDYAPLNINQTNDSANATQQEYTNFTNILNGNGGKKYDIGIGGDLATSVYMTWYPVDPLSAVFIDSGDYIVDNNLDEAGGDPKFVLGFQGFPASSNIDVQIVWNIEYLANPIAKPWLGMGGQGVSKLQSLQAESVLAKNTKNQISDKKLEIQPGDAISYSKEGGVVFNPRGG